MITNPKIGMRVQYISPSSARFNHIGTIISCNNLTVNVEFDSPIYFMRQPRENWDCLTTHLQEIMPLSPEEQLKLDDRNRRQSHAEKYL